MVRGYACNERQIIAASKFRRLRCSGQRWPGALAIACVCSWG